MKLNDTSLAIDEDDLCDYIAQQLGLDEDTVEQVLAGEMQFLERRGLVIEEGTVQNTETIANRTAAVDMNEVTALIVSETGLDAELVQRILDKELEYLKKQTM